nr:hypothetical protein GCM10020092_047420 [Actinoplanes digitatis]
MDLRHARVGELRDDPDTWPERLDLNGLTYEILEPQLGAARRVDWLARDPDSHHRQPYEQLAAVLRGQGRGDQARLLLLARQRRDTARGSGFTRAWGLLQDATVGYGYRPQRAAALFAALLVVGTVVFGLHPPAAAEPPKAPPFNALVYTLDLLLPIVDFGQQNAFVPRGAYQWISYVFIAARPGPGHHDRRRPVPLAAAHVRPGALPPAAGGLGGEAVAQVMVKPGEANTPAIGG